MRVRWPRGSTAWPAGWPPAVARSRRARWRRRCLPPSPPWTDRITLMSAAHAAGSVPVRRAEAAVDLDAIAGNVRALKHAAGPAEVLAVVKADAYGHGLVPCARAARAGGAAWLGTALVQEALALRAAGDTGRLLCWLLDPQDSWTEAVAADIDVSVSAPWGVDAAVAAAGSASRPARLHLKADTGLGRAGAPVRAWP